MGISADSGKQLLRELVGLTKRRNIALGYQKLTVAGTAVSLTVPANSTYAIMVIESSIATPAIRYLELGDKTLPTATDGLSRSNTNAWDIDGYQNLINFRAIQVGAGTHTLHIQYYK